MKRSHRVYDAFKRAADLVTAALLLVTLSPLLALITLAVRLTLGSPVLFRQRRPGRDGALFTLYKFRTMAVSEGRDDVAAVESDEQRLTRLGQLLRSTSLDELPELWNVLRGDMSIVGPRPWLAEYLELYTATQARRHEVRPGITGWAQVNGRNELPWADRLAMDVWYVDNRSLALDLRIMGRTLAAVVRREGISAEGRATMKPFQPTGRDTMEEDS